MAETLESRSSLASTDSTLTLRSFRSRSTTDQCSLLAAPRWKPIKSIFNLDRSESGQIQVPPNSIIPKLVSRRHAALMICQQTTSASRVDFTLPSTLHGWVVISAVEKQGVVSLTISRPQFICLWTKLIATVGRRVASKLLRHVNKLLATECMTQYSISTFQFSPELSVDFALPVDD